MKFILGLILASIGSLASAQTPVLDLRGVDETLRVEPTQVMVLGSAHLSAYKETVTPEHITPLLDRLAVYSPEIITIEGVPGEICEMIRSYPSEYPEVADTYCQDVTAYRLESGLTAAQGAAQVRRMLSTGSAITTGAQRRELAAAFIAAAEPHSALVQWMQLGEEERIAGEGLGVESLAFLTRLEGSMNESVQIAARLAARLGLERLYYADDHSSDIVIANYGQPLWDRMAEIWPSKANPFYEKYDAASAKIANGGVIEAYQFYNDPETQLAAVNSDFRQAMNDGEGEQYGRRYQSWYQVRNLRMVSNVVAAGATKPGGKVLAVVGSSHKPYFEAYLDQMHDIQIVSTDTVLR